MWAVEPDSMVSQISDPQTLNQRGFAGSLSHDFMGFFFLFFVFCASTLLYFTHANTQQGTATEKRTRYPNQPVLGVAFFL